jgi:TRAP-type C4-dicarboxylate transport system permease small subunit
MVFARKVRSLADFLNLVAGWCLVGMTALTCADVILRCFRHPILGTYEIVGFLGAAVAAFAMAHTTMRRGHVAVEVLVSKLSPRVQVIIYLITHTLSIILFIMIAYECARFGNDLHATGEVSLTLQIPFYPVLYGIAFASVVVCLVLVVDFWRVLTGGAQAWYRWEE